MRQSLVPVLLLATVAFSSSNVLPMLTIKQLNTEPLDLGGQQNDNIFSNSYQPRNILNDIFYTISIATSRNDRQPHTQYEIDNNRPEDDTNILNKHDKYNGEGFRKEQWHNYPRQLDRLHKYLYEHHNTDKRNPDPDDPNTIDDYNEEPSAIFSDNDIKINEIPQKKNDDTHEDYNAVIATNPFLIFKVRLACLGGELRNTDLNKASDLSSELEYNPEGKEETMIDNIMNPDVSLTKVKREEVNERTKTEDLENSMTKRRAVKKRIFSLWSRLQNFNHKGHELQHRRHLHAFYGLPDGDGGGGVLTAETRATFLRPPGSPLRWG